MTGRTLGEVSDAWAVLQRLGAHLPADVGPLTAMQEALAAADAAAPPSVHEAAVRAVLELHVLAVWHRSNGTTLDVCRGCMGTDPNARPAWPCSTRAAITGAGVVVPRG